MANPKKDTTTISVRIESEVMHAIRQLYQDPVRNKTAHGEISKLVNSLLKQHLTRAKPNSLEDI